jgi:hypothetical protein
VYVDYNIHYLIILSLHGRKLDRSACDRILQTFVSFQPCGDLIYFVVLPALLLVVFAEGLVAFVAVVLPLPELFVLLVAFCAYPWDGI